MSTSDGKNLTLYSNHLSPNGLKVSIYLEELKAVDPSFDYKWATKTSWYYLQLFNPGLAQISANRPWEKWAKGMIYNFFFPDRMVWYWGLIVLLGLLGAVVHQTKPKRAPPSLGRPFPRRFSCLRKRCHIALFGTVLRRRKAFLVWSCEKSEGA